MARRRKREMFKEWLSSFFAPKDKQHYVPNDQPPAATGGFFGYAQGTAVYNSPMTSIQGNQYTTYVQGDRSFVPQIMSLLSQHTIHGAAHDDSARTPPPRCHPNTRVNLITRITAWFEGQAQEELLLWITGPAGVGKSAIIQTFAEHLAKSKSLGASIFISRPNKRNNPHGIFITIAFQLATRIEAYRDFIVERLSLDPSLLNKDIEVQFSTFIVEPFVERKIGAGGERWGILLDGLDELKGEDAQCSIIQLISAFAYNHRDAPLIWIIASRPESHISNTFDDEDVRRSCWIEYIPIDSTEACKDVECFFRSSFKAIQKKYRQSVPSDWPSDADFLVLIAAASGLFVYAEVVMRFIRDPDRADPISQFKVLLSVINRSTTVPMKDNPFVHLDALYFEILSSIPSALWLSAKQLLGFTIYEEWVRSEIPYDLPNFETLRGMSILFGLNRHTVYACLTKCRSTLRTPEWIAAHKEKLTFLHASFADYLKDPERSGKFYVGNPEDIKEHILSNVFERWINCSGDDVATVSVEPTWHEYCSSLDDKTPSSAVVKFHTKLFRGLVSFIGRAAYLPWAGTAECTPYVRVREVHMGKLCYYLEGWHLLSAVRSLEASPSFNDASLYRELQLKDLTFEHLDGENMIPSQVRVKGIPGNYFWTLHRARSRAALKSCLSELEDFQKHSPELKVVIFGGVPKGRIATFQCKTKVGSISYAIPYLE